MDDVGHILIGLAGIVVLGVTAQWIAWRLRLPSILLLLVFGFVAGPVTGFLEPEKILGDMLMPVVSISVALILFEGGLSLRIRDLRHIGGVVRRLVSTGALVTWLLGAMAARLFLCDGRGATPSVLSWENALLLGAIIVVTGPTVIIPLLRHVRPKGQLESILRWEGIVIDPIGATLAVLVFEAIIAFHKGHFETGEAIWTFVKIIAFGGGVGLIGAGVFYITLKKFLVPDHLQNAVSLMAVVAVFTAANLLQGESGILAVTVMGIALANQQSVSVKHIIEFKENLQVLLISGLFIILSASLEISHLGYFNIGMLLFLGALIIIVRPLTVLLSTMRSTLSWKERFFLSMMAPRGIVAAAVASVFALRLASENIPQADLLLPFTFIVIISTVAFYGLGAPLVARWLGLAEANPQGMVIVGAHPWARAITLALHKEGIRVLLADSNRGNLQAARMEGMPTYFGNVLTEHALEEMELDGMGRMLALTPNDEVNSLAVLHFKEVFSSSELYQLAPSKIQKESEVVPLHLRGRYLFGDEITFNTVAQSWAAGARVKATKITEEFGFVDFTSLYGESAVPLFLVSEDGVVTVITSTVEVTPGPGQLLISLVDDEGKTEQNS